MVRPRDDLKQEAILAATLAEIGSVGLAGLSIDAVAKRAGVAAGTVYVYFKSKDALIEALYAKVKGEFADLVMRDDGLPVRLGVEKACRAYLDYCREHLDELVFLDEIELSPLWSERVKAAASAAMRPLVTLLDRGKAEHIVRHVDSALMLSFLGGALRSVGRRLAREPRALAEPQTKELIALCWSAISA
jgi:AcrR family transcriptional regulator